MRFFKIKNLFIEEIKKATFQQFPASLKIIINQYHTEGAF